MQQETVFTILFKTSIFVPRFCFGSTYDFCIAKPKEKKNKFRQRLFLNLLIGKQFQVVYT